MTTANREYEALTTVEAVQKAFADGREVQRWWPAVWEWVPADAENFTDPKWIVTMFNSASKFRARAISKPADGEADSLEKIVSEMRELSDTSDEVRYGTIATQCVRAWANRIAALCAPAASVGDAGFTSEHGAALRSLKVGEVLQADQWEAVCQFVRDQEEIIDAQRARLEASVGDDAPSDAVDLDELSRAVSALPKGYSFADALEHVTAPPAAPVVSESDALLIERAKDRRDMLLNWRKQMPAVWYGNSTLDGAAKVIDELLLRLSVPATDDKAPAVDAVSQLRDVIDRRVEELAERLIKAGPKAAHVSASECHEITEAIHEARAILNAAPTSPHDVDAGKSSNVVDIRPIPFGTLGAGDYQLERNVWAKDGCGSWREQPRTATFSISIPAGYMVRNVDSLNLLEAHPSKADADAEVPCSTHPDAPHGFDRNGSHNADRYVCECEGWIPPSITEKVIQDVCDLDPYDPDKEDALCVSVADLELIVSRHTNGGQP